MSEVEHIRSNNAQSTVTEVADRIEVILSDHKESMIKIAEATIAHQNKCLEIILNQLKTGGKNAF